MPPKLLQDHLCPFSSCGPRSLRSKRLPRSFRVLSAITTLFGSAIWQEPVHIEAPVPDRCSITGEFLIERLRNRDGVFPAKYIANS
jgi:hypothetical protein